MVARVAEVLYSLEACGTLIGSNVDLSLEKPIEVDMISLCRILIRETGHEGVRLLFPIPALVPRK